MRKWTADDVRRVIADPAYAIGPDALISKDDWVKANARLISEIGAETYLRNLLTILSGTQVSDVG